MCLFGAFSGARIDLFCFRVSFIVPRLPARFWAFFVALGLIVRNCVCGVVFPLWGSYFYVCYGQEA